VGPENPKRGKREPPTGKRKDMKGSIDQNTGWVKVRKDSAIERGAQGQKSSTRHPVSVHRKEGFTRKETGGQVFSQQWGK